MGVNRKCGTVPATPLKQNTMQNTALRALLSGVQIQEELISDLMRKNEEIREKRLGQLKRSKGNTRSEWTYSRWLKLQLNK